MEIKYQNTISPPTNITKATGLINFIYNCYTPLKN